MFTVYIIFVILTVLIWGGTTFQTFKAFKEAGIKGKAIFISITSVFYVISLAVPMIFAREAFFGLNPDSRTEGMGAIITFSSFFGAWLIASIISLAGRKYANNHMPVFTPTQVLPNTGIMGSQGYSTPMYPAPYPQHAPQNQYYEYGQGMSLAPQGYPVQAPMAYSTGYVNPYGQMPPQEPVAGYASYPYDASVVSTQEQAVLSPQPVSQENEEKPQ